MSDDHVKTYVLTDIGALHIQEHLVKYGFKPKVYGIRFPGIENARATTEVLKAIDKAGLTVLGPSNPINSIGPILNTKNVREKIKEKKDKGTPVIAMAISAKYARRIEDVVAIPERRVRLGKGEVKASAPPAFGASSHLARAILKIVEYNPDSRAAINIRYDVKIIELEN